MAVVYVLSASGKPLIPTTRCGHVRILLKEKKARVVERTPFTIQLTYETEEVTQPLYLGINPGCSYLLHRMAGTMVPPITISTNTEENTLPERAKF